MKKLALPRVTLVAVSSVKIDETINALKASFDQIDFKEVLLISHKKPENLNPTISFRHCSEMKSIDDYSRFVAYELSSYINTEFALVVQHDGYVLDSQSWREEFLEYDYIGAPWLPNTHFTKEGVSVRVGNGGFSLRSKKLLDSLNDLNLPFTDNGTGYRNEDGLICSYHRKSLEEHGIKFAPVEVASFFSKEKECFDSQPKTFGFHGKKQSHCIFPRARMFLRMLKENILK